jgi:hypothetical protein
MLNMSKDDSIGTNKEAVDSGRKIPLEYNNHCLLQGTSACPVHIWTWKEGSKCQHSSLEQSPGFEGQVQAIGPYNEIDLTGIDGVDPELGAISEIRSVSL